MGGDASFVVGATSTTEDTTGFSGDTEYCDGDVAVQMTLREYCAYASRQKDDCPLYIFDDAFLEQNGPLFDTYCAPSCFHQDFMSALGKKRPPHRWLLIGAERAGTALHIDPLETAA